MANEILLQFIDFDFSQGLIQSISVAGGSATIEDFALARAGTFPAPSGTLSSFQQVGANGGTADMWGAMFGITNRTVTSVTFTMKTANQDLVAVTSGAIIARDSDADGIADFIVDVFGFYL